MSDSPDHDSAALPQRPELSDDLPPVQPPSAGFIVQLFVVPGLIVLAVNLLGDGLRDRLDPRLARRM